MVWFGNDRVLWDIANKRLLRMDERKKTLNGIAAASLSILPGMGHLYLGVKRARIFLVCGVLMLVISKFFWETGWLWYIQFAIFAGVDAFAFAKRGRGLF
jgi:hypothetical protein